MSESYSYREILDGDVEENESNAVASVTRLPRERDNKFRITIEPVILFLDISTFLSDAVLTNLFMERSCTNILHYNESLCSHLSYGTETDEHLEKLVQPYAAYFIMWKSLITAVIPAILSLFLGPWSDLAGRKPLIAFPTLGAMIMYFLFAIFSCFPNIHPNFMLISVLPFAIFGGFPNFISASYCYISDISAPEKRSLRLGILEGSLFGGVLIGLLVSSVIFNATKPYGYVSIFAISATLCTISLVYLIFWVPESIVTSEESRNLKSLLQWTLVKEMLVTCGKERPKYRRCIIFLGIFCLAFTILTMDGESQVIFLFTRLRFGWSIKDYTYFCSFAIVLSIFGTIFGCWFLSTYLLLPDALVGIFAFVLGIGPCVFAIMAKPWEAYWMYVAAGFSALKGSVGPAVRSILSKSVPNQDLGKVFALTSSIESLAPIAAGPLYVLVYNATMSWCPGLVFSLTAGFYIVNVLFFGIIAYLEHKYPNN